MEKTAIIQISPDIVQAKKPLTLKERYAAIENKPAFWTAVFATFIIFIVLVVFLVKTIERHRAVAYECTVPLSSYISGAARYCATPLATAATGQVLGASTDNNSSHPTNVGGGTIAQGQAIGTAGSIPEGGSVGQASAIGSGFAIGQRSVINTGGSIPVGSAIGSGGSIASGGSIGVSGSIPSGGSIQ